MNPSIKKDWCDALRSGSYKKCKFQLKDETGRCDATGVLCELAVAAGVLPAPFKHETEGQMFFGYVYGGPELNTRQATGLPEAVAAWSGLSYRLGYKVAMMGDSGMSFNKLADWIEDNL